jgi:hypothetical protein
MHKQSFYESLVKGIGDAIDDVRTKAVEEPWFGRAVTERESVTVQWPQATEAQPINCSDREQSHEPEQDIDR